MSSQQGWIGVDLDGTLAHYDGWKGADHIGEPIPAMVERVKQWLSEGPVKFESSPRAFTHYLWLYSGNLSLFPKDSTLPKRIAPSALLAIGAENTLVSRYLSPVPKTTA